MKDKDWAQPKPAARFDGAAGTEQNLKALALCPCAGNRHRLFQPPVPGVPWANCAMCRSLDYLTMSAAILDRTGWEKTVGKMIDVMGAPIREADRQIIVAYLARYYGK